MKRVIICLLIIVLSAAMFAQPTNAITTEMTQSSINSTDQGFTFPDGKTVEEIISEVYSPKAVDSLMNGDERYTPDNYWCDPSVYALEFHASKDFLENLKSFGVKGIEAAIRCDYPNVYIPIFSSYEGTTRIVGHTKIYYSPASKAYTRTLLMKNAKAEEFISGKDKHFLDEIDAFNGYMCVANAMDVAEISEPILVRLSTAFSDSSEKVLLVMENKELYVYDFQNTVHAEGEEKLLVKTVDQYVTQRTEYEQLLASKGTSYGGLSVSNPNAQGEQSKIRTVLLYLVPISVCAIVICIFVIYRQRKTK